MTTPDTAPETQPGARTESHCGVAWSAEWFLALASEDAENSDEGLAAEIGDLQRFARAVWDQLGAAQRRSVIHDPEVRQLVDNAGGSWQPPRRATLDRSFVDWLLQTARDHG